MSTDAGQTLSHYRLIEKIGEGGMGVVYRAEDVKLHRPVALKFLTEASYAKEHLRARFLREARTAAALNHPGICTIYEVGEVPPGKESILGDHHRMDADTPFIAMELIEGQALDARLKEKGPPAFDELLRIAVKIAEGLTAAHTSGIVHRDLKPGNVMLTPDGRVKILDFGLAKPLEPAPPDDAEMTALETASAELTREGRVLGTVAYMSPEQAQGKPLDSRSDVFSFGILLYEMAAGQRPFRGESPTSTLAKILETEPEPLDERRADLPAELQRIIRRCLRKRPDDRFNDTRDLLAALKDLREETTSGAAHIAGTGTVSGETPMHRRASLTRFLRSPVAWILTLVVLAVAVAGGSWLTQLVRQAAETPAEGSPATAPLPERTMIAVLPLENLGLPEDEYFAAGFTEELTSRLASMPGLGVISRASASQYAGTDKTTRQIGEELGVEFLLRGSVRWARTGEGPSRVRITPTLIRVADDTHLWADTYDAVIEDIFAIQSEIARQVTGQLGVVLRQPGNDLTAIRPTENAEAYQAYLRGLHYAEQGEFWQESIESFQRAVALDPSFALAWAMLAEEHSWTHFIGHDFSEERRIQAREALERAIALAPEAPQVRRAAGLLYYHQRDYPRALAELEIAGRALPSNVEILRTKAFVLRRQARWDEAVATMETMHRLNPLESGVFYNLGETHMLMRHYTKALEYADQVIALAPEEVWAFGLKVECLWHTTGKTAGAREVLESIPEPAINAYIHFLWWRQETFERNYDAALYRLATYFGEWFRMGPVTYPTSLLEACVHHLRDAPHKARLAADAARLLLERALDETPDDPRLHRALGLAHAFLGNKDRAIRLGRRAVELQPYAADNLFSLFHVHDLAWIYVITGEYEDALEQLYYLLSLPSHLSVPLLRLDPIWEPLHGHPRFERLEAKPWGAGS